MAQALALARRGLGLAWPNPSVGSIVVSPSGEIVGRGWTAPGGRPHAEAIALDHAGERASGATLYVTLEPCAHAGRGPACAEIIAEAGPSRVVIGLRDPLMGEDVLAFVALKRGEQATEQEIMAFCQEHLAKFKCPKQVRFIDSLPKSPIGKSLRKELRALVT